MQELITSATGKKKFIIGKEEMKLSLSGMFVHVKESQRVYSEITKFNTLVQQWN